MTVRTLYTLATAMSLGLAGLINAQAPNNFPGASGNQQLADAVAARLSSESAGADLKVKTTNGLVEISGTVVSRNQALALVQQAMSVPGTIRVQTSLKVADLQQASADAAPVSVLPLSAPSSFGFSQAPAGTNPPLTTVPPAPSTQPPPSSIPVPVSPQPLPGGAIPSGQEPLPMAAPTNPSYDMTGPHLPPYAWPTYAPYPNMSRVAYPQAYPYNAFPFIGPFYPFPKVPLGWRSVKLEWDDGHWYMGRLTTPHDYWRVRFW